MVIEYNILLKNEQIYAVNDNLLQEIYRFILHYFCQIHLIKYLQ